MRHGFWNEHRHPSHRKLDALCGVGIRVLAMLLISAPFADAIAQGRQLDVNGESPIADVTAAWQKRAASIKSIALQCEIETTVTGRGDVPNKPVDPFTKVQPKRDRILKAVAEFAYENGKTAIRKSSDVIPFDDPETIVHQVFHATFDGKTNASLLEQTSLPMGSIERTSTPTSKVAANLDFIALGLWMEPTKCLSHGGWPVGKMRLENEVVEVNGVQCRRLRIPRGSPRFSGAIDVDPKLGWVPVRWQTWLDGKPSTIITIEYRLNEELTPVVNEWTVTRYHEGGKHAETRRARVIRIELNAEIDDGRFTMKFPPGTHVSEKWRSGYRYYIQMPGDILMPIKESDFGRTSLFSSYPKREPISKP